MTDYAVRVEGIGKRYRLGAAAVRHSTLREALTHAAVAPLRNLRSLRGLSRFGDDEAANVIWALRNVSFSVRQGEVLGVVGRNGAGKSTLLKVLSRVTSPSSGFAEVRGRVGSLLEVGTGFHPELTGRENLYLNGSILGMDRRYIDRRFEEIVEFAEIERFLDTPVKRYSSGMYLRLAFAIAAHLEPDVLMVDEVLAVGDVAFQRKCLGRMDGVVREGRTILFVSHNLNAVQRLCPRCILIESGTIAAEGPTVDILAAFLSRGSADLAPREWMDLSHAIRSGRGGARIAATCYASSDPAWAYRPVPLAALDVHLAIEAESPQPIGGVAVWLSDRHGGKLLVGHTGPVDRLRTLDPGRTELRTRIKRLYLNPGTYLVGMCVVDDRGDILDQIDAAFPLEVAGTRDGAFGGRRLMDGAIPCEFELLPAVREDPAIPARP
jgi:ABC-type polysaccharide/polyol phosphate transport system ATPase subunit